MAYEIEFTEEAEADVDALSDYHVARLADEIERSRVRRFRGFSFAGINVAPPTGEKV